MFFADPRSPWQRGTNENTNGLLRHYFPKGTDLSRWSAEEIEAVAHALNTRPRKVLWKTPAEPSTITYDLSNKLVLQRLVEPGLARSSRRPRVSPSRRYRAGSSGARRSLSVGRDLCAGGGGVDGGRGRVRGRTCVVAMVITTAPRSRLGCVTVTPRTRSW